MIFAVLLAWSLAAPPAPGDTVETFEYTVQEGDTCAAIAKRFYGDSTRYDIIHAYNKGMGPQPHKLKPGRVFILPRVAPSKAGGPDAEVTATRRKVEARAADEQTWKLAELGLDLYRGWRVNTAPRSGAELTFRDDSVLELRENTLVIIFGATHTATKRSTTQATLDRGALRSRLGELAGAPKVVSVESPSAEAELGAGSALVTVDTGNTSRVANHGGKKANVRGRGRSKKRVAVAAGMGSKVAPGGAPTRPIPLPPAPGWRAGGPTRFVSLSERRATIVASWQPEPSAKSYRVELARRADGREVVAAAEATGAVDRVELHGVPPGDYWLRVASIDGDAFEGIPGDALAVRVVDGALVLPDGSVLPFVAPPDDTAPPALEVPAGTRFRAPAGMSCRLGTATATEEVALRDAGANEVVCTEKGGTAEARLALTVIPWAVALPAGATAIELMAGTARTIELSITAGSYAPSEVVVTLPPGVEQRALSRTDGGGVQIELLANADARNGEAVVMQGDLELARIAIRVVHPTGDAVAGGDPSSPSSSSRWMERWTPVRNMWELGVFGGVMVPSQRLELFEAARDLPDQGYQPLRRVAPSIGLRAGYFPLRVLGVELDGAVMPTRTRADQSARLFRFGGQVVGRIGLSNVVPYLLAGVGLIGVDSPRSAVGRDVDAALHIGGGMEVFVDRWVALRLDVRDVATPQRGVEAGLTSTFEISLGVSATLGRRQAASRRRPRRSE